MNSNNTNLLEAETGGQTYSVFDELVAVPAGETAGNPPSGRTWPEAHTLVGKVCGFAPTGFPLVDFSGNPRREPLPARHICPIAAADLGHDAVLVFENNDLAKPIVLGLLQPDLTETTEPHPTPVNASLDGKQVTLTAENEIVLRCGKASITLTRAGKVLISGEYLLSRSEGVNRIKGGSVQIN